MENIFKESRETLSVDDSLVTGAMNGNRQSIEQLISRHQRWVYNIALRMVGQPADAQDVAQDVLMKIVTNLPTFEQKSSFRTWAYRIVVNHVLNMKRRNPEKKWTSFSHYGQEIDDAPDHDPSILKMSPVEKKMVFHEVKMHCFMGTLLCLNRKQRLAFILGEMFCICDSQAAEILECSKDCFRQTLSRARRRIVEFLRERCGFMDETNKCRCLLKAKSMMDEGVIDPENLQSQNRLFEMDQVMTKKYSRFSGIYRARFRQLIREQPFLESPDFARGFREILNSEEFMDVFNLQH